MRMQVPIIQFHLVVLLVEFVSGWICSGLLNGGCNDDLAEERCSDAFDNVYVKPASILDFPNTISSFWCSVICYRKGCSCSLYFPDKLCRLMFTTSPPTPKSRDVFILMGKNVASGKTVTASTESGVHHPYFVLNGQVNFVVILDGVTYHDFYHSDQNAESDPWLQIDLATAYRIKGVRVITRQDYVPPDRFQNIKIYVGNTAMVNKNYGSHVLIAHIEQVSPDYWTWYNVRVTLTHTYRYVVIKREPTIGRMILEIAEIEVLA